jgi:uncharacterized repeat protein (TIGR03943 family)
MSTYKRTIPGVILAGWGLFILEKVWSGKYLLYINRRYEFLILAAGVFFLVISAASLRTVWKRNRAARAAQEQAMEEEQQGAPPLWSLLVLAAPLLLGSILTPQPLGSAVMANRGVNATAPLSRLRASSSTALSLASTEKSILDWAGDFSSNSDPSIFRGQLVDVTGFVYHDPRLGKDQFFVGRFVVTCCVADAVALGMVVDTPDAGKFTDNSWVEVKGSIYVAEVAGQKLPGIDSSQVLPMPSPEQPYLFP